MEEFPDFIKDPRNRIAKSSQYTKDVEGYIFNGRGGSQAAFWTCYSDRRSEEHSHEYDEYLVCVHGEYRVFMNGETITLTPGNELFIPKGVSHCGECIAGTRTIHVFGGKRAEREMK